MRVNNQGMLCKGNQKEPKVWLVKSHTNGNSWTCHLRVGTLILPREYFGKRIMLKVIEHDEQITKEENKKMELKATYERVDSIPQRTRNFGALSELTKELIDVMSTMKVNDIIKIQLVGNVVKGQKKKLTTKYKSSSDTASKKLGIKVTVHQRDGDVYLRRIQ